jgi:glucokinase
MAAEDGVPTIVARNDRRTPRDSGDAVIAEIVASGRAVMRSAGVTAASVVAAGCSAPGPLDHVTGVVIQTQNIVGFDEMPLASRVADGLGVKVFVDRDTCMAAVGEATAGAARGAKDFVYVTVSTGVGAAIVSGGRMVRGASNTAGELGHWPVAFQVDAARPADADIPRCGCGSFGCVEAFAAGANLAAQLGVKGASEVYAAAASGDARATALIARAERALANLAVGVANGLNPALIVVGGSIAEHQPAHVIEPMRRAIAERAFRAPAAAVRLVPAALGADVGMLGAVLEARERAAGRGAWFL